MAKRLLSKLCQPYRLVGDEPHASPSVAATPGSVYKTVKVKQTVFFKMARDQKIRIFVKEYSKNIAVLT